MSRLTTPIASPPGMLAADVHLGDVHAVAAERRADEADQAGAVAVGEDEQGAVEVGVEPVGAEPDQAEELLAEEGAGGDVGLPLGRRPRTGSWCRSRRGRSTSPRSIAIPRSLARTSALTRLTCSSSAASIQPAAKLAVISRVFLCGDLAAIARAWRS